jgi:hypothetical protein
MSALSVVLLYDFEIIGESSFPTSGFLSWPVHVCEENIPQRRPEHRSLVNHVLQHELVRELALNSDCRLPRSKEISEKTKQWLANTDSLQFLKHCCCIDPIKSSRYVTQKDAYLFPRLEISKPRTYKQ